MAWHWSGHDRSGDVAVFRERGQIVNPLTALWLSIVLGACAQIFLKRGVGHQQLAGGARSYLTLVRSGWVWAWGICFLFATGLWMVAISTMQVSYPFPFLPFAYLPVPVVSIVFLKERVPASRWVAIAVIAVGVALIFKSN